MIHKCREIKAFEFSNSKIRITLSRGNPVYGSRLCVYKRINPIEHMLVYDETSLCHGFNGWVKGQYDESISLFLNKFLDSLIFLEQIEKQKFGISE